MLFKMSYCNRITILNRNFHTTNTLESQYGRFMKKVLKENKSKRKWQIGDKYTLPDFPSATNLSHGAAEGAKSANSKRVAVLNKLFMRHITDLMATGSSASVFLGRGLEINRVKVTPDFKGVNVFWIAKGTEDDAKLDAILTEHAGALRHELSQLKVMGVVPKINFVKDKAFAKLMEVDLRLAKADFGEDYVPVDPSYKFKSDLNLTTTLSDRLKAQIVSLEIVEEEEVEEPLPLMRMDVLGLNHSEIMLKVQKSIKKSQAPHRKLDSTQTLIPVTINEDPVEYHSQTQQKEAFQQFLLKKQILRTKAKKDKYNPEYEYIRMQSEVFEDTPFINELKDSMKDSDFIDDEDK